MARRAPKRYDPNRLFNPAPFVHYRRRYEPKELRWGLVVATVLCAITGWVIYRGAHPDPRLFAALVLNGPAHPTAALGVPAASARDTRSTTGRRARDTRKTDRGPFPKKLAPAGWQEGPITQFGPDTLYRKINGRESYYKSFGFKKLYCVTLSAGSTHATVDLELYDLTTSENALGAYAGERGKEGEQRKEPDQRKPNGPSDALALTSRVERNALYLARGKYYLRAIGSDERPTTRTALGALQRRLIEAGSLGSATLPRAYRLFADIGIAASKVAFVRENAFSFDFGRNVYTATVDANGTQLFWTVVKTPTDAQTLARRFVEGFASYGKPIAQGKQAIRWVKDRYLGRLSTARAISQQVFGVRSAATYRDGMRWLRKLEQAVKEPPKGTTEPLPKPAAPSGQPATTGYGEHG